MKYEHLFFDLDCTLWDFERNSVETLTELFDFLNINEKLVSDKDDFITRYQLHNINLWKLYSIGNITKEELRYERFRLTFEEFNLTDAVLIKQMGDEYVKRSPLKKNLINYSEKVLNELSKKYQLHIITNGFEEVQFLKLKTCEILHHFNNIITSETADAKKPDKRIYDCALQLAGANSRNSLMIGDSLEADVIGAMNAGIDQVYFNPKKLSHEVKPTYEVGCLSELLKLL